MTNNINKQVGILLPISSIPSNHGIGDFGNNAYKVVDLLKKNKINLWQILPMHPSVKANSPYRAISSYAGDEIYISLEMLTKDGLLNEEEIIDFRKNSQSVEYDLIRMFKHKYLMIAHDRFVTNDEYYNFINNNKWVKEFAIFRVFAGINDTYHWPDWEDAFKDYFDNKNLDITKYQRQLDYFIFIQYIFYKQWFELKNYANENGVLIFGDMPIYVDVDSTEVWLDQKSFLLDENGNKTCVAGVPPDYFSETGQNWGNPIYNWDYLQKNNFNFWIDRLNWANQLFDITRIDHFRAFDTYWQIPANETSAINGTWFEAPGYQLFDKIYQALPTIKIVAEDLGELRKEVYDLKNHYHLKGMKVFQFQMDEGFEDLENTILYTGTHDNETVVGWFNNQEQLVKEDIIYHLNSQNISNIHLDIIKYCLTTNASDVIIPIWDLLGLDNTARFNIPGTTDKTNWCFRVTDFSDIIKAMDTYGILISESL